MSSTNVRTLSSSGLDALLTQYGAATFGSNDRKRARLQRFLDAEVDAYTQRLAATPPRRTHAMTTRSQQSTQRSAARDAVERIRSIIASYLA